MICFEWTTGFIPTKKQEQESEADYKKFHLFIDLPLITKYFGHILSCVQIWRENEMYRLKGPYVYCDFRCDYLLLMDVNDWMSCECSDEDTPYGVHILRSQNIHYSYTRSHPSEKEYRIFRNRTENCKCVNEP